ncbi:MAG: isoleucine--tRNA ligase [Candidatus Marinimicrobia bacterium]|nr:isoleucine--tRNA ligase [Candidatus Neomarinimicrobiota bacterium]MBL7010709.1 isoleucine--tRNA ligase [Candidatus Neomarinimicrobiota bacterium]MBL7030707.1 isoleucine--tRNA ligase [Candidatus Neomarinimicrobiota bacterium]
MIQRVNPQADFIAIEHQILDFWKENNIFQKRRDTNAGKPKWSFIDGPITANNPMGVHHAWGRTLKDVYNRYKAMDGHELRYQNGFDCQGLWVEVEVEKELGFKSKREVEEYGIEKFVNLCKERVRKYSDVQTEQSKRLGYWMDWDNSYYTMSDENNYTIWGFLKKLFEEDKIYRGSDVVPWSGRSGTSYSQMEIIEGRKLVAHKSVFVRFPLRDKKNEYLLIWTTTPWTLTSNVVAGVNGNLDYVKLKAADESIYYFAQENLEFLRLDKQFKEKKQWVKGVPKLKTIDQIFKERGGYEILGTIKGSDMVGWTYDGPYDAFEAQSDPGGFPIVNELLKEDGCSGKSQHQVVDPGKDNMGSDIVVAGEGTGIVHMAPGCGDIDNKIGKKLGLVNIAPLDSESKFMDKFGWLTGKTATDKETTQAIIDDLKEREFLVYVEDYPHVYPHCWRSGDELVFRLVDEWYINMDWRHKIKKVVDEINWIPEWGGEREHEWLDNMGDWMISKKRFWGLALPIWTFEDDSYYVVGSKAELKELAVEGWDEFDGNSPHRPWIDKVKIKHPESGLIGSRIKDVGNPWLDAGIVPFSTLGYNNDKEYWNEWFPGDFVTESFPGQFRNWFYSLLAMSALLEERAPFKTLLGHALVKAEDGRDMHKSWGNAIWFDDAAEEMGVDVMRWMYAGQNPENNLLFGYHHGDDIRKKLIQFWNSYSFFATYAAVDGFDPSQASIDDADLNIMDEWILSKLHLFIKDSRESLDQFRSDLLMKKFDLFLDELSNWYIRRSRRRFWKSEDDSDKQAAYAVLYEVLTNVIKILAPILPFVTENIYQNLVRNMDKDGPESVHLCDYPIADENKIDSDLMDKVDALRRVVELGRSARNKANLKIRQPLAKLSFNVKDNHAADFIFNQQNVVLDELNVKSLHRADSESDLIRYIVKPNLPLLGQKFGKILPEIRKYLNDADGDQILVDIRVKKSYTFDLNGELIILTRDDLLIETESAEGYTSSGDDYVTVGLTIKLTEELIQEGIVRDVIRQVQTMRKNANFAVEDRIIIYGMLNGIVGEAIRSFEAFFKNEVLAVELIEDYQPGEFSEPFQIGDQKVKFGLQRVKT